MDRDHRSGGWIPRAWLLGLLCFGLIGSSAQAASPYIHAHRGGSLGTPAGVQVPVYPESSLEAFEQAAKRGFVLELDVKLTADDEPVVIHDPLLDRTTNCTGLVRAKTAAELRAGCRIDELGTTANSTPLAPGDPRRVPIPTLAEVLDLALDLDASINLEIKNVPTDGDFDPAPAPIFATATIDVLKAKQFPPSRTIIQSFWPNNLDPVQADPYFEGAETSFLTLAQLNDGGPAFADSKGYDWISPAWPVSPGYIQEAHALGLRVVPYTIDTPEQIKAAAEAGVDAVITNDPLMARAAQKEVEPAAPETPAPPSPGECRRAEADRLLDPIESFHPDDSGPRMFALQFKQELRHVETYASFRTKVECMIREYVLPRLADDRPNVVALDEDIGLMTLATGSRGRAAREIFADPSRAPGCAGAGAPCGAAAAIGAVQAGYADQIAAYRSRYPSLPPIGSTFVGATDTFGRGWMQLFSDMARRYDVYILGSNNQAPFRESRDPSEIALFADPDIPTPDSVFVATGPAAYNEAFLWAPGNVRREGPRPLRNVVLANKKVPLTPIEELIEVAPGPSTGPDAILNLEPYALPGTGAKMGFATSKPAFEYGHRLNEAPPAVDPCADTSITYMRCLDALGTNVVLQDEANAGTWPAPSGEGNWQPLEWMRSTWRAVGDRSVGFEYNVTPHLVGNLADIPFDGQTAITQRGLGEEVIAFGGSADRSRRGQINGCTYIGNSSFQPADGDPGYLRPYSGPKTEFLGLLPWVSGDGPRDQLRATGQALAPGSGDSLENDYAEGAIVADLPFPPDPDRAGCNGGSVEIPGGECENLQIGTSGADQLIGSALSERLRGLRGSDSLLGRGGVDCLEGGPGQDQIRGNASADRIQGGKGADRIRGGKGADTIRGGRGRDKLIGGSGDDTIFGGKQPDTINGSGGDDRIDSRAGGIDVVRCGKGNDLVEAGKRDKVAGNCERVR